MAQTVVLSEGELFTASGEPVPIGALPSTLVTSTQVTSIVTMLKAAYTALATKVATTLYITTDTGGIFLGSTVIVAGS